VRTNQQQQGGQLLCRACLLIDLSLVLQQGPPVAGEVGEVQAAVEGLRQMEAQRHAVQQAQPCRATNGALCSCMQGAAANGKRGKPLMVLAAARCKTRTADAPHP
jgi:hypothetical protein